MANKSSNNTSIQQCCSEIAFDTLRNVKKYKVLVDFLSKGKT